MSDTLEGCLGPIDPIRDDWLPWYVLFASALDIGDPDRRQAEVLILAAAYRALFGGF